jgi:hypothetical protein
MHHKTVLTLGLLSLVTLCTFTTGCGDEGDDDGAQATGRDAGMGPIRMIGDPPGPATDPGSGGMPEVDATGQPADEPEDASTPAPEGGDAAPSPDGEDPDAATTPTPDEPVPDAGRQPDPDAAAAVDAGPEEASPDAGPRPESPHDRCGAAATLADASEAIDMPPDRYTHRLAGPMGGTNDYNPLQEAGLPPGCALVWDAAGHDVAYELVLQPGDTVWVRLSLAPASAIPAVYLVEGCPVAGWPDIDESGLCGDNEYETDGFCQAGACPPLEWSFTWPQALGGQATVPATFWLVLDELNAATADSFELEWAITGP